MKMIKMIEFKGTIINLNQIRYIKLYENFIKFHFDTEDSEEFIFKTRIETLEAWDSLKKNLNFESME